MERGGQRLEGQGWNDQLSQCLDEFASASLWKTGEVRLQLNHQWPYPEEGAEARAHILFVNPPASRVQSLIFEEAILTQRLQPLPSSGQLSLRNSGMNPAQTQTGPLDVQRCL